MNESCERSCGSPAYFPLKTERTDALGVTETVNRGGMGERDCVAVLISRICLAGASAIRVQQAYAGGNAQ